MSRTPLAPTADPDLIEANADLSGVGGGPGIPADGPNDGREFSPGGLETPPSAYRMMTLLAMLWSIFLFATITLALEWRWGHSPDWVAVSLPHILYLSTALLALGSVTFEMARRALRVDGGKACARWITVTIALGVGFLAGQLLAWRELASRGLHVASNPGSFFFYLLTGAHGVHLLVGIVSLVAVRRFVSRPSQREARANAVAVMALYWHFMDGLWLALLALLFITIQR
jgi:cytochrome c oxidase subunit III